MKTDLKKCNLGKLMEEIDGNELCPNDWLPILNSKVFTERKMFNARGVVRFFVFLRKKGYNIEIKKLHNKRLYKVRK